MLEDFHAQPARDRVIVALDCDAATALCLAVQLRGHAKWLKVGMTLYYAEGPKIRRADVHSSASTSSLDLKFHDIPHQVEGAAASAVLSGADMLTMHAVGGSAMMAAGHRGAEAAAFERKVPVPATLEITVLTSMDAESLAATGVSRALPEQVSALAVQAREAGLGIVCSPQEAEQHARAAWPGCLYRDPGRFMSRGGAQRVTRAALPRPRRLSRTVRRISLLAAHHAGRRPGRRSRQSPQSWRNSFNSISACEVSARSSRGARGIRRTSVSDGTARILAQVSIGGCHL